jgi:hypothetical protein
MTVMPLSQKLLLMTSAGPVVHSLVALPGAVVPAAAPRLMFHHDSMSETNNNFPELPV